MDILIVDDDAEVRQLLKTVLELHGHAIFDTADPTKALWVTERFRFDLAFIDLGLPGTDSLELIRSLKMQMPELKVVAMSEAFGFFRPLTTIDYTLLKPLQEDDIPLVRIFLGE